jgi:hypothetical protein
MAYILSSSTRLVAAILVAALVSFAAPRPASADGAASTRNIIFGAAAVGAGTLIWLNHNKKVHEKYAEYDRRQASTQAEANNAEAAYESERQAYAHEAALVDNLKHENAIQHAMIEQQNKKIATLQRAMHPVTVGSTANGQPIQVASYGWGSY